MEPLGETECTETAPTEDAATQAATTQAATTQAAGAGATTAQATTTQAATTQAATTQAVGAGDAVTASPDATPARRGAARRLGSDAAATASAVAEWIARPRVRLTLTGVALLAFGALLTSSVWTLPLVIAGSLMVGVAWIGRRLEGRLAIEWGPGGTQLAFRATIRPAGGSDVGERGPAAAIARAEAEVTVIEGEAHTVEIDVAELEALIAAAETGGADAMQVTRQAPGHDAR